MGWHLYLLAAQQCSSDTMDERAAQILGLCSLNTDSIHVPILSHTHFSPPRSISYILPCVDSHVGPKV